MVAPKLPLPESDDPLGFLRYLGAEICQALLDLSDPDISKAEAEAALDRLHGFSGEMWLWTTDIRNGRN
jgi:hypothetical protein